MWIVWAHMEIISKVVSRLLILKLKILGHKVNWESFTTVLVMVWIIDERKKLRYFACWNICLVAIIYVFCIWYAAIVSDLYIFVFFRDPQLRPSFSQLISRLRLLERLIVSANELAHWPDWRHCNNSRSPAQRARAVEVFNAKGSCWIGKCWFNQSGGSAQPIQNNLVVLLTE